MHTLSLPTLSLTAFWSLATVASYVATKAVYRRRPWWWLSPVVMAPVLLALLVLALHGSFHDYGQDTHWLVLMIGPATVAFAIPIYKQRVLIQRQWPVLLIGILVGSGTAMLMAWAMASALHVNGDLRLSLLPRSVSTPFAMAVSGDIGGVPELTAIFVVVTGIFGAAIGDLMLSWLPLRSGLARGALFGMSAHGFGTAKAYQVGAEEGAIAGLVMVFAGLLNVLAAPALAHFLG